MPIVARLSKKFCDRLGDDNVEELVALQNQVDVASRTGLRELNESNFARSDAKLEQRTAEILAKTDARFADVRLEIASSRESTLRWMVAMWFTQMLAFAGMWLSMS